MSSEQPPKLIIDTDWKSQAQAEKERLAQKAEAAKPAAKPGAPAAGPGGEEARFEEIVSLLVSQAIAYMGGFVDPRSGQAVVAPDMARVYIDLLGILQTKTKGNLTPEEDQMLSRILTELRLEFAEVSKAIEKAVAEGRIKSMPTGGGVRQASPGMVPGMSAQPGTEGFGPR